MKRKAYIKPQMEVVPFHGGDLLDTVLPGTNETTNQFAKEFYSDDTDGFDEEKEDEWVNYVPWEE